MARRTVERFGRIDCLINTMQGSCGWPSSASTRCTMLGLIYPPKWDVVQLYVKNYYPHCSDRGQHMFMWLQQ